MDLRNIIIEKMPLYYYKEDTYKDASGRGILIRFLGMLGTSIQEDLVEPLEDLINQLDPETATTKFLSLLAFTVGNPIDILGTDGSYRLRLMQAISLYKLKGTARSYHLLFNLLGYKVEIEELFLPDMRYDTGLSYDDDNSGTVDYYYDLDECSLGCTEYRLTVYTPDGELAEIDPAIVDLLILAIRDIEPINMKLHSIVTEGYVGGIFTEQFTPEFT